MRVVEDDSRGDIGGIFEFEDPLLQASDVFTEQLRPCLSPPIVVLTHVGLLGFGTLLTRGLCPIASLETVSFESDLNRLGREPSSVSWHEQEINTTGGG